MDIEALRVFVTVCEEKKMSRAAEKLFMSKQALSSIVKKIENELNTPLLIRKNVGVELTPEGDAFFGDAKQMLELWTQCTERLERMKRAQDMELHVSFAYMSWNLWSKESEEAFAKENPHIHLQTEIGLSREILKNLDEGKTDMVITCMQTQRYGQYDRECLCDAQTVLQMTQKDPLAAKRFVRLEDLDGRTLIYPDSGEAFLNQFCDALAKLGIVARPRLVPSGNYMSQLRTVQEEKALRISNTVYQSRLPDVDGFVVRRLASYAGDGLPVVAIYALMPHMEHRSEAANRFLHFFRRHVLKEEETQK